MSVVHSTWVLLPNYDDDDAPSSDSLEARYNYAKTLRLHIYVVFLLHLNWMNKEIIIKLSLVQGRQIYSMCEW